MSASTRSALITAAVVWVLVAKIGVISVYVFDYYEPAWGPGGSIQVYALVATVSALLAAFGAELGFRLGSRKGRVPGPFSAAAVGFAIVGILYIGSVALPTEMESANFVLGAGLIAGAITAAFVSCKLGRTVPSNNRLQRPGEE